MEDFLSWGVLALLGIAAATTIGKRLGVAVPLLLAAIGIAVGMLPFATTVTVEPEWILTGVLPPLLYSAAVSMPTMEFKRDFTAISGLSVILVVISACLLGYLLSWLIPGLGLAGGIAVGAIASPTDAVAISIVKRLGVSPRAVAVLEGESLLNDASALVILRSAIAGMAASVSLWAVLGDFLSAVVIAGVIGWVVGEVNLRVRARISDPTVNTVISFTIPFIASLPAEHLHASGLVAAVVAGLVTGRSGPRFLSPRHRLSDTQNWRTIELVLEGGVFLVMGLELRTIIQDVNSDGFGIDLAIGIAALILIATVLIRAAYVAPLIAMLQAQSQRGAALKPTFVAIQNRFDSSAINNSTQLEQPATPEWWDSSRKNRANRRKRFFSAEQIERFNIRLRRQIADIDYFLAEPLGWREGVIVVWAGLRGVVTLAAAQTLPETMPNRSLLILIAFLIAVGSLLLQGGTLPRIIRALRPAAPDPHAADTERKQLMSILEQEAVRVLEEANMSEFVQRLRERLAQETDLTDKLNNYKDLRLRVIEAQRTLLLDARDNGEYSAAMLSAMLENLDADQISLELKGGPTTSSY